MDRPIIRNILKSPYFWTGIVLFAILIAFSYHKEQQVEKDAEAKVRMMVKDISVNNILALKNIFRHYEEQLEYARHSINLSEENADEVIAFLSRKDDILKNIQIVNSPDSLTALTMSLFLSDSLPYIQMIAPLQQRHKALALKIDLRELHEKIAESKSFSYAYLTLSWNNRYVFHPDESKIGDIINAANKQMVEEEKENRVVELFSEYLNIPVYSYFEKAEMGGETWIFTANVPGIGIRELVSDTRDAFVFLSLLALLAFAFIFFFGIMRWRREFIRLQHLQAEKMRLELKNEQQKKFVLSKELEQLKSGLNPHFLFNSLSSLKILVDKQPQEAKRFAVALSNLYRYLLKQEKLNLISLSEELRFTQDYIYLQQIRFSDRIVVETSVSDECLSLRLPPMSLQLLVENCIKHTKMSAQSPLKIDIYTQNNHIVVKNNYNPPETVLPSGKGLNNLTARYSYLTTNPCEFYVKDNEFIARIPLL